MYCTVSDIESRLSPHHLIELADDDNDGAADSPVVEAAIADADSLIDAHLRARYVLPFDPAPALLRKISADLAVDTLFARRRESASPRHAERAQAARDLLAAISRGELLLAEANEHPLKGAPDSTTRGQEKRFSRHTLIPF